MTPRRTLLKAALAGYAVLRCAPLRADAPPRDQAAFLALSAWLMGRGYLEAALGARLFDALQAQAGDFSARCTALLSDIQARHLQPDTLQRTLEDERSPLAPLPRQIVRAWVQGVVGERCLAYEQALNARMVADVLTPPSYAYGAHGSWAKPVAADA